MQFLSDVLEVDLFFDFERGLCLFRKDVLIDVLLETAPELRDVFNLQRQTNSIGMSTEVLQQITTTLHRIVDIIVSHTAGRACCQITAAGEYNRGTIVHFRHT